MEMKKYIAEFIGTFFLLFVGTGAIIINQLAQNALGHIGIALVFGFVIVVLIYACGHISGAHFNPAVTISFFAVGKFSPSQVVPYIVSQLSGALSASAVLRLLFGNLYDLGGTFPSLPVGQHLIGVSFAIEFIFTFFLMFVIISVATDSRAEGSFAGLAIGLTVFIGAAVAGPVSGGSFNPARSIAPAVMSGNLAHLWLYVVSPVLGAVSAAVIYKFLEVPQLRKQCSN
ncbi:MIP family channel protein [Sporomusa sp.]|uniref:MIP family channel protein n=1 Tax=Sporomusa sp. TaxID=2078658 RepID=UPI002BD08D7E|nr:MIP family channel protein [Sporomusa sp.]HWR07649.1 MIP family channel protein [Sporomusa sp.]